MTCRVRISSRNHYEVTVAALHLVLCLAENAISASALRNDDIICLLSGLTCEINNTDAEARIVTRLRGDERRSCCAMPSPPPKRGGACSRTAVTVTSSVVTSGDPYAAASSPPPPKGRLVLADGGDSYLFSGDERGSLRAASSPPPPKGRLVLADGVAHATATPPRLPGGAVPRPGARHGDGYSSWVSDTVLMGPHCHLCHRRGARPRARHGDADGRAARRDRQAGAPRPSRAGYSLRREESGSPDRSTSSLAAGKRRGHRAPVTRSSSSCGERTAGLKRVLSLSHRRQAARGDRREQRGCRARRRARRPPLGRPGPPAAVLPRGV